MGSNDHLDCLTNRTEDEDARVERLMIDIKPISDDAHRRVRRRMERAENEDKCEKARAQALMETRIERPRRIAAPQPPKKPWHWHVYVYVHAFLLHATWRSVLSAIVKWTLRLPLAWLWKHAYMLVTTIASRNIGEEAYHVRMKICCECSQGIPRRGYLHCRVCCPRWCFSRLEYKNRKQGHNCPLGLHSGSVAITKGRVTHGGS